MTYTLEQIEEMARSLHDLPAMDDSKRKLTKQAATGLLKAEITALQQRGYTIEQITESLHGVGFDITTATLKSYLQRANKKQGKAAPKRERDAAKTSVPRTREAQPPASPLDGPKADGVVGRSGKQAFLVKDKDTY